MNRESDAGAFVAISSAVADEAPFSCPDPSIVNARTHIQQPPHPMDLSAYLPVILFIAVGVGVGIAPQVLGFLLGPNRPDAAKNSPYECGFEAFEDARMKFDVRYYLVAILFILFDLEIAFLFPWAVALKEIGAAGFWAMMIFLAILVVGFVYEWKKGALDWE
jgi:NADH-quinone oxidoreductase subunit A